MIYNINGRRDSFKVKALEKIVGCKIGKLIYHGYENRVFLSNNKILKIVEIGGYFTWSKIFPVLHWAKTTKPKHVSKIFNFGSFSFYGKEYYFYVMEKLNKLPSTYDEELSAILLAYLDYPATTENVKLLSNKVGGIVKANSEMKYVYHDIHSGNIMMDKRGTLKFVDLEGFQERK